MRIDPINVHRCVLLLLHMLQDPLREITDRVKL
jgi:hypothetical protein